MRAGRRGAHSPGAFADGGLSPGRRALAQPFPPSLRRRPGPRSSRSSASFCSWRPAFAGMTLVMGV